MFESNPKYGSEFGFHERQVELYAKYDKDKLLLFLRSCNDIPLQKVSAWMVVMETKGLGSYHGLVYYQGFIQR